MRKFITSLLFAFSMWVFLIWRAGYGFGSADQVELLPYSLFLDDPSLYSKDFFLHSLNSTFPNERILLSEFLRLFSANYELACFVLHLLSVVLLITGMQYMGLVLVGNISIARIAILLNFSILYNHGLGDVELYSDVVQASSISIGFVAFALYYFFRSKYVPAFTLISLATIIHPLEGLTVFLVMAACISTFTVYYKEVNYATCAKVLALYIFTAGVYSAWLVIGKSEGISTFDKQFDGDTFFRIYYEFRHPHHFLFAHQLLVDKIAFIGFSATALFAGFNGKRHLLWFSIFSILGVTVYAISTDILHLSDIANLQFYKVVQWLKFIAVLCAVNYSAKFIPALRALFNRTAVIGLTVFAGLLFIGMYFYPAAVGKANARYQFTKNWKQEDDMVAICTAIEKNVSRDALFIQPFTTTELKFFGRVSLYTEWKAFPKNRGDVFEWYRRTQQVYGVSLADTERGFYLQQKTDAHYEHLSPAALQQLKQEGVTHMLTLKTAVPAIGTLILQNNTYAVYQL